MRNFLRSLLPRWLLFGSCRDRLPAGLPCGDLESVGEKLSIWVERDGHHDSSSIEEILVDLDITREELNSYCRKAFGMSFLSWKKRLRIDEAKLLLLSRPDMSASAVGKEVGIFDKSDFRRQFRSLVGFSPVEYREKMLK